MDKEFPDVPMFLHFSDPDSGCQAGKPERQSLQKIWLFWSGEPKTHRGDALIKICFWVACLCFLILHVDNLSITSHHFQGLLKLEAVKNKARDQNMRRRTCSAVHTETMQNQWFSWGSFRTHNLHKAAFVLFVFVQIIVGLGFPKRTSRHQEVQRLTTRFEVSRSRFRNS